MARKGTRKKWTAPDVPAWAEVANVGYCDTCGKKKYPSRKAARAHIRRLKDRKGTREYRCPGNRLLWHVGRLPQATAHGLATPDEVYGRSR